MELDAVSTEATAILPSGNRLKRLGKALATGPLSDEDQAEFDRFRNAYGEVNIALKNHLGSLGLESVQRLKNVETIREKIARDSTDLGRMRDIAGTRLIVESRLEQDRAVEQIIASLSQFKASTI
jgi:ppGpp synthetase/RelA/SpoT-type nucleotidyltranferase